MTTSAPAATLFAPAAATVAAGRGRPWRHRFACFHVVATWLLLIAGATVTSHDAGLAVPDWPTSFGILNPILVYVLGLVRGLATYEHGHRVAAMVVGLLTIVETIWLWRTAERRAVRVLGVLLLAGVLLQGALGGATVLLRLPPATSIGHGLLAQTFFCLSIATAWLIRERNESASQVEAQPRLARCALLAFGAVYVQLLLGAIVRHTAAKERIATFADLSVQVHAAFAAVVLIAIGRLVAEVVQSRGSVRALARPALSLVVLVPVQALIGILSIVKRGDPAVTVLHVIVGATILGACMLLVLRSREPQEVRS